MATSLPTDLLSDRLSARALGPLTGVAAPPGDKSISHRALILSAIAEGTSQVDNLLEGEDVLCTAQALRTMGIDIQRQNAGQYVIQGKGLDGLEEPVNVLDMGNSGTAMRLMAGLLASRSFLSILTGDESLRSRPMDRVVHPLTRMGAKILGRKNGRFAPLVIQGTELLPMEYTCPVASAQVKSALLLAGLNTPGETVVIEPIKTRDHSERLLAAFGAKIQLEELGQGQRIALDGWPTLTAQTIHVPGDFSAAAFLIVAALLVPGSDVTIQNVGMNPTRTGLLELLTAMGAHIQIHNLHTVSGEPVADLQVQHQPLTGIHAPPEVAPRAIDEYPIFFVAAACAEGETLVTGVRELRVKESDRIAGMVVGLRALGVELEELPDGVRIQGRPGKFSGGVTVDSLTDHRLAMSFLVAGLVSQKTVTVSRCQNIKTSFPNFVSIMQHLGAAIA